jgi:hypothetical protein
MTPYQSSLAMSSPDGKNIYTYQPQPTNKKPGVESNKAANVTLHFVKNEGQMSAAAFAYARMKTYTLWATKDALVFDGVAPESRERDVIRMQLLGIRPEVNVEMDKPLSGKVSYLMGNDPAKWVKGVGLYQEIVYREIYPHIDLRVAIKDRRIEYDFVVRPGGDLKQIRFAFEGAAGKPEITGEGQRFIR